MNTDDSAGGAGRKRVFVAIDAKTGCYPRMAGMGAALRGDGRRRRILGRKGQVAHCYHLMSRTCGGEVHFDAVDMRGTKS